MFTVLEEGRRMLHNLLFPVSWTAANHVSINKLNSNPIPVSGVPGCVLPAGQHEAPAWTAPPGPPAFSLPLWHPSEPESPPASSSVSTPPTHAPHT